MPALLTEWKLISILQSMENVEIAIIYQDHHLLIVNKPAGLVIHPTYKHADGTFWDALLAYSLRLGKDDWQPPAIVDDPEWAGAPTEIQEMLRKRRSARLWKEDGLLPRPCLLHRLDKDTSGVVALARTERARRHMIKQFHEHTIVKRYLAVVQRGANEWSRPRTTFSVNRRLADGKEEAVDVASMLVTTSEDVLVLDGPLQRDPDDRRRCIVGAEGQAAKTEVRVLAVEQEYALLDVRPVTGRTHQIRAHLAALGYAIVGDQTYAPVADNHKIALARQFLHAYSLQAHSYPGNEVTLFVAPLPDELVVWLQQHCPGLWKASGTL